MKWTNLGCVLVFGAVLLTACAHTHDSTPAASKQLGWSLPPEVLEDVDFVRVRCVEKPMQPLLGCVYVGWFNGELCAAILESRAAGGAWTINEAASSCNINFLLLPPNESGQHVVAK